MKKGSRNPNFTDEERLKLIKFIKTKQDNILNKKTDNASNKAKEAAWDEICERYNASSSIIRSKESLKRLWEKLKFEAKVRPRQKPNTDVIITNVLELLGCKTILDDDCEADLSVIEPDILVEEEFESSEPKLNDSEIDHSDVDDRNVSEETHQQRLAAAVSTNPDIKENYCGESSFSRSRLKRKHSDMTGDDGYDRTSRQCMTMHNEKKLNMEKLRYSILMEEHQRHKELHDIKMESAKIGLEIKRVILNKIKGGEDVPTSYAAFINLCDI